ncbi:esterase-like protein [Apiospora marii]|uniref:Esterase-like protein n=1 Tax=Apiospora marii TaxID=335849 RepID=A0ABR1R6I9_9PEZI
MRRCPALRGSSAISNRIFQAQQQCRPYASKAPSNSDQANISNAQRPPAPSTKSEDDDSDSLFNDWEQAFQIDSDAKTIETAAGSLPLSPVMDPSFWARREQYTKRKPKKPPPTASKPQSLFERQFAANAFAQALATPVRYESMTRERVPSFFLQDFHLLTHPETGQPWWVPRSLALDESKQEKNQNKKDAKEEGAASSMAGEPGGVQKKPASSREKLRGPNAYAPARKDVLAAMCTDRSGFYQQWRFLFGPSSSQYKTFGQKSVWRQDMDEFVLGLMRQHVERDLLYLSRLCVEQGRYFLAKCFGWGDVQYKHKGAVLWFGDEDGSQQPADGEGRTTKTEEKGSSPGPFATFEFADKEGVKTAVAVHNMPMLLGEETAARVRKEAGALQDGAIFMLAGRRTTDLQLKLWKLQGYLSDYR